MTLISLVCLLVLSSSAMGRSNYGSFSSRMLHKPRMTLPAPLPTLLPTTGYSAPAVPTSYGSNYGATPSFPTFERPKAPTHQLTEFDIMCQGKRAEHIIPLGEGERWVVCLDDSKGVEQSCPKDLILNLETRECKPKFNKIKDLCATQPCLNGGQCIPTEYAFQCQCTPGFDGKNCELDARICQTQQPCGQSFGVTCQSFHLSAALQHVCIVQEGLAYGLNAQQVHSNPCLTGSDIFPLAFSNKGFITCNGEQMHIHSCPGGTLWDSLTKVCVWPEFESTTVKTFETVPTGYGSSSYDNSRITEKTILSPSVSSYGASVPTVRPIEQQFSTFGVQRPVEQQFSTFGVQRPIERNFIQSQPVSSYGQVPTTLPRVLSIPKATGY